MGGIAERPPATRVGSTPLLNPTPKPLLPKPTRSCRPRRQKLDPSQVYRVQPHRYRRTSYRPIGLDPVDDLFLSIGDDQQISLVAARVETNAREELLKLGGDLRPDPGLVPPDQLDGPDLVEAMGCGQLPEVDHACKC